MCTRRSNNAAPPASRHGSGAMAYAASCGVGTICSDGGCRCLPRTSARSSPSPTYQGRPVLRTVGEAANYIIALPHERAEHCKRWRHAAELLLDQADVAAVSHQVHLALFYDTQLDIGAMKA